MRRLCHGVVCAGLFLLLGCGGIAAQEKKSAELETLSKEYNESGRLRHEVPMKGGKIDGVEKWYYESGLVETQRPYKDGKQHGEETSYYPDANIKYSVRYENGYELPESRSGVFYTAVRGGNYPGSTYSFTRYEHGVPHGVEHMFFLSEGGKRDPEKDVFAGTRPWVNGQIHGTVTNYNCPFFDIFAEDGWAVAKTEYVNSLMHGKSCAFDKDGRLLYESSWVCGEPHGSERHYYADGKLRLEIPWKLGERHGKQVYYDKQGKVEKTIIWDMGQKVGEEPKPAAKDDGVGPADAAKPKEKADQPKGGDPIRKRPN